jgi:nitrite reductase/ring-hydroxylating ferredoxin subunit/uncharacterized membrane protein
MTSPLRAIPEALGAVKPLDKVAKPLGNAIDAVVKPGALKDLLSGTWLGHPLHPMLTDVVIGSWTSSMILDVLGGERARDASDLLVGVGVLSAIPTAASGLSDWVDTWGETRRVGLAHAAGNVAALVLYAGSLVARRRGARGLGVALGFAGGGIASATAYLGGHLVYGRGVGVDAAVFDHAPKRWTAVADESAVQDGKPMLAKAGDTEIVLVRHDGVIRALAERCTHRGGPMHRGEVEGGTITCPGHGSVFTVVDGSVVRGPATAPQPCYETRVREGKVEVRLGKSG